MGRSRSASIATRAGTSCPGRGASQRSTRMYEVLLPSSRGRQVRRRTPSQSLAEARGPPPLMSPHWRMRYGACRRPRSHAIDSECFNTGFFHTRSLTCGAVRPKEQQAPSYYPPSLECRPGADIMQTQASRSSPVADVSSSQDGAGGACSGRRFRLHLRVLERHAYGHTVLRYAEGRPADVDQDRKAAAGPSCLARLRAGASCVATAYHCALRRTRRTRLNPRTSRPPVLDFAEGSWA